MRNIFKGLSKGLNLKETRGSFKGDVSIKFLRTKLFMDCLENCIRDGRPIGVFFLDMVHFFEFEQLYGSHLATRVIELTKKALEERVADFLPKIEILAMENLWADDFVIVFALQGDPNRKRLSDLALSLRAALQSNLNQDVLRLTGGSLELHVGFSLLPAGQGIAGLERKLYAAIREAQQVAKGELSLETLDLRDEFQEILDQKLINTVYQPIVNLSDGTILGWEALARGPAEGRFRTPDILFSFAEEVELLFPLEKVCREQALRRMGAFTPVQKLFLNIHPRTICDPNFTRGKTMEIIKSLGLNPSNIIFEITERHSIRDFAVLNHTLEHYRNQGYLVAVDDVGTGYSGLQSIAEIRPDYLKIDMSLVQGIDSSHVRKALMETLVTFAEKIGSAVIAEGIETEAEMVTLMAMGVHYGQGFFIARPGYPKPELTHEIRSFMYHNRRDGAAQRTQAIEALVEPVLQVERTALVEDVKRMLNDKEPIKGIVVVDHLRPVGLIMRHHLDRILGSHYGVALFFQRSVDYVMDHSPMIIDADTAVPTVAEAAMNRERGKIYDYVIVTRNDTLLGVVSVQKMLDFTTRWQVELAKGVNPLTGLPGNLAIEREIEARVNKPFSLLYIDLDHFKSYNDHYGFEGGDRMLSFVARLLTWAVRRHGRSTDFVGHVGGDDYVIICDQQRAERICVSLVRCFSRVVQSFYNIEDRRRGTMSGLDRSGQVKEFPLVSMSIGIVDCVGPCEPRAVAERAAEIKRYAKSIPGNKYVRDRRSPFVDTSDLTFS